MVGTSGEQPRTSCDRELQILQHVKAEIPRGITLFCSSARVLFVPDQIDL